MYDWEHGRRLVAFTTGDPDSVRNAVERHIPEGGSLRVEPVERSLDALTRTRDKVTDDWKELENEGISVIAASVDVVRNDVEIRVLERTEAAVDRLRRYGEAIRVTKETPTVADSCAPDNCSDVWGGIRAWFHDGDWTHYCTTGYNVMRTDLNPDKLAMLTAGFSCNDGTCNFIHHMKVWDWDSWPGDSGGIVVEHEGGESTTRLIGSHVHSETSSSADESWFTTVHYAQYQLEQYQGITIEPCTNSACS